jgi:hypothetical protein
MKSLDLIAEAKRYERYKKISKLVYVREEFNDSDEV